MPANHPPPKNKIEIKERCALRYLHEYAGTASDVGLPGTLVVLVDQALHEGLKLDVVASEDILELSH